MPIKEILSNLLKQIFKERLDKLEKNGADEIESLQNTSKEYKNLDNKIEQLVLLRKEKEKIDEVEREKKEKEKADKVTKEEKAKEEKAKKIKEKKERTLVKNNTVTNLNTTTPAVSRKSTGVLPETPSRKSIHNLSITTQGSKQSKNEAKKPLNKPVGRLSKLDIGGNTDMGRNTFTGTKRDKSLIKSRTEMNIKKGTTKKEQTKKETQDRKRLKSTPKKIKTKENDFQKVNIESEEKINSSFHLTEKKQLNEEDSTYPIKADFEALITTKILFKNVIPYLKKGEEISLYCTNKKMFIKNLKEIITQIKDDLHALNGIIFSQTIDDKIADLNSKYSEEELSKEIPPFVIGISTKKAMPLLDNTLYHKIFKGGIKDQLLDAICPIYRMFCQLIQREDLVKQKDDRKFWDKFCEFLLLNCQTKKISDYLIETSETFNFDDANIEKLSILCPDPNEIIPNNYTKICGTTGLVTFLIKDALEYSGIIEDKKTPPARLKRNLLYQKGRIERILSFEKILNNIDK